MAPAAGLLAMRQPQCRYGGDGDEAVRAMPRDGITSRQVRGSIGDDGSLIDVGRFAC
jgi:hypothetical protein